MSSKLKFLSENSVDGVRQEEKLDLNDQIHVSDAVFTQNTSCANSSSLCYLTSQ